jgi:hypothetical protein
MKHLFQLLLSASLFLSLAITNAQRATPPVVATESKTEKPSQHIQTADNIHAFITTANTLTTTKLLLKSARVLHVTQKEVYLQDATGCVGIKWKTAPTLLPGDQLDGFILGKFLRNIVPLMLPEDESLATLHISHPGEKPIPKELSPDDVEPYGCQFAKLINALVTTVDKKKNSYNLKVAGHRIKIRFLFKGQVPSFHEGDRLSLTGLLTRMKQDPLDISLFSPQDLVRELTWSDRRSDNPIEPCTDTQVSLHRSLKAHRWNTLCLPFSLNETQLLQTFGSFTLMQFSHATGNTLYFSPTREIEAGKPYVIQVAQSLSVLTFPHVSITPITEQTVSHNQCAFIGTYAPHSLSTDRSEQFLHQNRLSPPLPSDHEIPGFRAYFRFSAPSAPTKTLQILFLSNTTPIHLPLIAPSSSRVYGIDGRPLPDNSLPSGRIYIKDGKKYIQP